MGRLNREKRETRENGMGRKVRPLPQAEHYPQFVFRKNPNRIPPQSSGSPAERATLGKRREIKQAQRVAVDRDELIQPFQG